MKKFFLRTLGVVVAIGLLASAGCSSKSQMSTNAGDEGKLAVYTSFYTMYDFAKKIGGDKVSVSTLVPPGTEPHDWEPKVKDISRLEKARVFIYNGATMESWVDKVLGSLKNKDLIVVEASKDIKLIEGDHHEEEGKDDKKKDDHEEHGNDPHVWLNPMYAKKQMEVIKDALVSADPGNKEYFEKNFEDNAKKLDALDKEYKETVSKFSKKEIVVAHQAFGYLCEAYGLTQIPIEGLSADAEPTAARMVEISKFARENKVKVIFFEELVSPKVAQAIAKEVGAETDMLNPIEGITDEDIKAGKEYFSVMRDNLEALRKALQ